MNISDLLDRDPENWDPNPGDKLVGTLVEITTRDNGHGPYPLVEIETADGRLVHFHAWHTVAASELAQKNPAPGDRVGVKYLGVPAGKSYESYRVMIERQTPAPVTAGDELAAAQAAVSEAAAAHDAAVARNDLLIPVMKEHGFATAGEAIDYLEANPPAAQALDVSKLKQYEDEEPW